MYCVCVWGGGGVKSVCVSQCGMTHYSKRYFVLHKSSNDAQGSQYHDQDTHHYDNG